LLAAHSLLFLAHFAAARTAIARQAIKVSPSRTIPTAELPLERAEPALTLSVG